MKYNRPIANRSALKIERKWNRMYPDLPFSIYLDGKETGLVLWGGSIKQTIIEPGKHRLQIGRSRKHSLFKHDYVDFEVEPNERIYFVIDHDLCWFWKFVLPTMGFWLYRKRLYIKQVGVDRLEPDEKVHEILG